MSQSTSEYIVGPDGRIFREDKTRTEVDVGDQLERAFAGKITVKSNFLLEIPDFGPAGISISPDVASGYYWTVALNKIVFTSTFQAFDRDGVGELYPTFKNDTATRMRIEWNLNDAMANQSHGLNLKFVAHVCGGPGGYNIGKQYLFAYDEGGNAWRLPTSNLYDHGELCNGTYDSMSMTVQGALIKALTQFRQSPWNSDLYPITHERVESTANFFRFKPLDKGFQTLPIIGDWRSRCSKLSTPILKHVVV